MIGQRRIAAVLMRGGTSKGLFFHRDSLPDDPALVDRVILAAFGGGDPFGRQIDGLGGATSTTSKVIIVGRASAGHVDVEFTFGQVSVTAPLIDWSGTCGNLTSAVGPFAIEEGLVRGVDPVTPVRIWQTNTRKLVFARVPTERGVPAVEGDYAIDGVFGRGAKIVLEFLSPGGAMTGRLLPTGHATDRLNVPGVGELTVSMVDAVNPVVFARAEALGLTMNQSPEVIDGDQSLLARIEAVRAHAAVQMGLASTPREATIRTPGVPKIAFVSPPSAYTTISGAPVAADAQDLTARIMSMGHLHRAFAASGAACAAVAALIEGSLVHEVVRAGPTGERVIRLGHPSGVIDIGATVEFRSGEWHAEKTVTQRTARRLMEGSVLIPATVWPDHDPASVTAARTQ